MSAQWNGELIFRPGDRVELYAHDDDLRHAQIPLDPALNGFLTQSDLHLVAETLQGTLPIEHDPTRGVLSSSILTELAAMPGRLILECIRTQPSEFRLRVESTAEVQLPTGPVTTEQGVSLAFAGEDAALLREDWHAYAPVSDFRLSLQAARLGMIAGFDQLLSLPWLREVELLEHQLRTARTVLRRLRGRA